MKHKVSVIIPTRGRPDFLPQAVFSVAASGFPESFEILVVHDGEPIRPMDGVRSYATASPQGMAACMNIGFTESRGDYLTVCEDDDMVMPHKLALLAGHLDIMPEVGAVFGLAQHLYPDGFAEVPPRSRKYARDNPLITWETIVQRRGLRLHGSAVMYRRSAWLAGGQWDESLGAGEEWEWHLRLLKAGVTFAVLPTVTDVYRIHEGQKSARAKRRKRKRMDVIDRINQRYLVDVPA
jgi:glycosyltransferase involved in cell wall biosynthesis